jgi:hypothetical protein
MTAYGVPTQVSSDHVGADCPDRGKGAKWGFSRSSPQSRANRIFSPTGALRMDADPSAYVSGFDSQAVYRLHGQGACRSQQVSAEQSAPG